MTDRHTLRRHRPVTMALFAAMLLCGCSRKAEVTPVAADDASAVTEQTAVPGETGSNSQLPQDPGPVVDAADDPCQFQAGSYDTGSTPEIPTLTGRVTDNAGVINLSCQQNITERLAKLEPEHGAQVAVLTVYTLNGQDIDEYANKVFQQWKLGRKGTDDGVLLVVAIHDHRARIEVGYGLEGILTDGITGDILRANLRPNFAEGHYSVGVSATVDALIQRINATPVTGAPRGREHDQGQWYFLGLMVLLSIAAGVVGAAYDLRWYFRVSISPLLCAACVLVGVPLHLIPGYPTIIAMVPVSLGLSIVGILLVRATRQVLQWLGCWLAASIVIDIVVAIIARAKGMDGAATMPWLLTATPIGFFLGTLIFILAFVIRGSTRVRGSGWTDRPNDDSSSRSASESSSSSGSSSSDSEFSGGGGESGGGGASSDW